MSKPFRLAVLFILMGFVIQSFLAAQADQIPLPGINIPQFVQPLPHFAGARVNASNVLSIGKPDDPRDDKILFNITVSVEEFQQKILPESFYESLPAPFSNGTYVWGYKVTKSSVPKPGSTVTSQSFGPLYPAFTLEVKRGVASKIKYVNNLPVPAFLQDYVVVDQTLHWANPLDLPADSEDRFLPYKGPMPIVTHLHGAEVKSQFDGGPDQWMTPNGIRGMAYRTYEPTAPNAAVYFYPNRQEPTTLFYHDHALGATRTNVYSGLAGFYLIRDATLERPDLPGGEDDTTVIDNSDPANPREIKAEIELAIQDRMFDVNGQLYFPHEGDNPMHHPFWMPEFFGDVILVNGKPWPYLNVEPRRYRFRVVNGSNARFYELFIQNLNYGTDGPAIWQIGSDGGLLDKPVKYHQNSTGGQRVLLLAPGERADLIVDFKAWKGQTLILRNKARAPYPNGDMTDPLTTGKVMQFRVGRSVSGPGGIDPSYDPASGKSPRVTGKKINRINTAPGKVAVKRQLTLNEVMGMGGPHAALLNNTPWSGVSDDHGGMDMTMPDPDMHDPSITELPVVGTTEIWEIINMTGDAHPIHLHLVQFQLISRERYNVNNYTELYESQFPGGAYIPKHGPPNPYNVPNEDGALGGNPGLRKFIMNKPVPPNPGETGWKDTVVMHPGEVTRIAVRFTNQEGKPYPFDPTDGPGYVWHCHIIDHEDNEMMRPYNLVYRHVH